MKVRHVKVPLPASCGDRELALFLRLKDAKLCGFPGQDALLWLDLT